MDDSNSPKPIVLICDDEPQVVAMLGRQATRLGLEFIGDSSCRDVYELARKYRPAVIILDIMQELDGRDVLANLKKDPLTRDLKVVIFSALEDQYTRRLCLDLGADDYAVKPSGPTFMSKIARLVHETCARVDADAPTPLT
jgi:two-component system response regulator AdeR